MGNLYDAMLAAYQAKTAEADEQQSAPAPDAVNKPEHDGEKPGMATKSDKKTNANADGHPLGPDNPKKMKKEAQVVVTKALEESLKMAEEVIERRKHARDEAERIEEEINKIASLSDDELESQWGPYIAAGQQFAIGAIAGQAKMAMEMDAAEGGGEVEELVAVVADGVSQQIADTLPPEQLQDPAIQQDIAETSQELAEVAVEKVLTEGEGEAAEMGGGEEMMGGAPPEGGGAPPAPMA